MKNKLNTLTKFELIKKLEDQMIKNEKKNNINENEKENNIKENNSKLTFTDLIIRFRNLILSLTIVTLLLNIFKKYKSIRAVLKLANYIIITLFGISIFDAFGLGFLVKFLGELKYVFGAIVAYLTDSTFYKYLINLYNIEEEKLSTRSNYKKANEVNWKEEFEKAERRREIEKWKERYEKHQEDEDYNKKAIFLLILFLSGSIATWYYGPELLHLFSPIWNMKDLIKKILRGGRDDDNDDNEDNSSIILEPPYERNISPEMLVYSSDQISKNTAPKIEKLLKSSIEIGPGPLNSKGLEIPLNTGEITPTQSNITQSNITPTDGEIKSEKNKLFNEITKSKSLKHVETKEYDPLKHAQTPQFNKNETKASSSKITLDDNKNEPKSLKDALSNQLNKIRHKISDESLEESKSNDEWTDKDNKKNKGKAKFLEAIIKEEKPIESFKIPTHLKSIKENYPNLTDETLKLLNTPEGLANRKEIINSLSDEELNPIKQPSLESKITPIAINENYKTNLMNFTNIIKKGASNWTSDDSKEIEKLMIQIKPDAFIPAINKVSGDNNLNKKLIWDNLDKNITNIIDSNIGLSKQEVIEKLISENPNHKKIIFDYVKESLDLQLENMKEKLGEKTFNKIEKVLTKEDIKDLHHLSSHRSIDNIKIVKSVNRTHNKLLDEIKNFENKDESNQYEDTMNLFD